MKRNAPPIWMIILFAMAAALNWAAETSARPQDLNLTFGFALGKGFVENSEAELFAIQGRADFRWKWATLAYRTSWVAQSCNGRPNPKEKSILVGVSFPLDSGRYRISLGLGIGETTLRGGKKGLPCEIKFCKGVFGLTVFANYNRAHNFYGVCASFDFPLRIFKS